MTDFTTRDSSPQGRGPEGLALLFALEDRALRVRLPRDCAEITIGRDRHCAIRIHDDSVSRRHAKVVGGSPPALADLGSRNGTFVASTRLLAGETAKLRVGMSVQLGSVAALVQAAHALDPESLEVEASDAAALSARPKGAIAKAAAATTRAQTDGAIVLAPAMREAYAMIELLGPSRLPVLILGETGVGKDVYAEALHRVSNRAQERFLRLNCAALPEALLEAELFGYERGAFTGAVQGKMGLFEAADGGTVFLDEVGEMPFATQAKLLRVLESGEVLRIGSLKPQRIDVRFVSATHRELDVLAVEGKFRMDLYYRLNGVAVWLPPLRERREEIEPIAEAFAARAGNPHPLAASALSRLQAHDWPGNVRELRNVMDRAALLSRGAPIDATVLQFGIPRSTSRSNVPTGAMASAPSFVPASTTADGGGMDEGLAAYERANILAALERTNWNRSEAARQLGISRNRLLRKLDEYGVARARKPGEADSDGDA